MLRLRALSICLYLAALSLWPSPDAAAAQQVHRCVDGNGNAVFTDRSCSEMHAAERTPAAPIGKRAHSFVRQCARTPDTLLSGVRSALEAQDVNRLAAFYHWTGISSTESVRLMTALDALSRHPLIDVLLLDSPRAAAPASVSSDPTTNAPPPIAATPLPDRIRIEQLARAGSIAPLSTTLRLHKNLGCWWIRY